MSTRFWDPCLVLDVYPLHDEFSCTATTKQGRRCGQAFIDMRDESDRILEILSSKDVVTYGLDERMKVRLRALAEQTLCPRWHRNGHQSQTNDVYLKWRRTIHNFIIEERSKIQLLFEQRRRPVQIPEPSVRAAAAALVGAHDRAALQPEPARELRPIPATEQGGSRQPIDVVPLTEEPARTRTPNLEGINRLIDQIERRIVLAERARQQAPHGPASVLPSQQAVPLNPGSGNNSAVDLIDQHLRREGSVQSERVAGRVANAEAAEVPAQAPAPIHQPVLEQLVSVSQNAQRPARAAGDRKSLAQDCYVCYEPFEGPDDAVWCRRKCGQNLHRACFEEWARNKERRDVKCGYCRASWMWE